MRDGWKQRVAYVGHSYGAQWGAILAAVDRRFKTAILVGGAPTLRDVFEAPPTAEFRKRLKPGQLEKSLDVNRPLDAINFVGLAAPIPLFFQFATFEQNVSRAAMDRLYEAAREPKRVAWYDTGHDLNDPKVIADRDRWLTRNLPYQRFGRSSRRNSGCRTDSHQARAAPRRNVASYYGKGRCTGLLKAA